MLRYALVSALLLIGLPTLAEEKTEIKKSELDTLTVYKDSTIEFKMKNDSIYRGDIITPDCLRGKIYLESREKIKSYRIVTNNGFRSCRFSNLERIA